VHTDHYYQQYIFNNNVYSDNWHISDNSDDTDIPAGYVYHYTDVYHSASADGWKLVGQIRYPSIWRYDNCAYILC